MTRLSLSGLVVVSLLISACGASVPAATNGPSETPSPSTAPPAAAPVMEVVTLDGPGASQAMGYLAYFPPSYAPDGEPSPLLVFLHGAGEAGDGSEEALGLVDDLGVPQLIAAGTWPEARPFVVLAPQYPTAKADAECEIADELDRFLEWALLSYNIDRQRVYLTGISCGAIGIWDYMASHAGDHEVAATVTISGHGEWALEEAGCELATMPPMWAFHGALDDVVPVVHIEGPMEQIRVCDGADRDGLELTIYPDADHLSAIDRTYDGSAGYDLYAWLLQHTNQAAP